jgi:4-hydroxy-tetrahydrodipicolinate reductase
MDIILSGYGQMGKMIHSLTADYGIVVLDHVDEHDYQRLSGAEKADAILDFSHPAMLPHLAAYVKRHGCGLCCGTTGYGEKEQALLREASEYGPVLYSANFSLGIAVFRKVLEQISSILLPDFDVEIVETHHRRKADSPSGTAKVLADAIDPGHLLKRVSGREGMCGARSKDEMGIFAQRGGTVAGRHTVSFFGDDETFSITHEASSRRIFAAGVLRCVQALNGKPPGLYTLDDLLF